MAKILKNNGYFIPIEKVSKRQLSKFTYEKDEYSKQGIKKVNILTYSKTDTHYIFPRFSGIKEFGKPDSTDFKCLTANDVDYNMSYPLLPKQQKIIDIAYPHIRNTGGGYICIVCGGGKTVMALYLMTLFKLKTVIMVNNNTLAEQWAERIEQYTPDAKVLILQGSKKKFDIQNYDIIITTVQTLSSKSFDPAKLHGCGFAIYDEAHNYAAEIFSKSLLKTTFKYVLGLTATPRRKDGLMSLVDDFVGDIMYLETHKEVPNMQMLHINVEHTDDKYTRKYVNRFGGVEKINKTKIESLLVEYDKRNKIIKKTIKQEMENLEGKFIILNPRPSFLEYLNKWFIEKYKDIPSCVISGEVPKKLRNNLMKKSDVIFATYRLAKEGLDLEKLNTMFITISEDDITQASGRVGRDPTMRSDPRIIIMIDNILPYNTHNRKHYSYYKKCKYNVEIKDYKIE